MALPVRGVPGKACFKRVEGEDAGGIEVIDAVGFEEAEIAAELQVVRAANHAERFAGLERVVGLERAAIAVRLAQARVTAAGEIDAGEVIVGAGIDAGEAELLQGNPD